MKLSYIFTLEPYEIKQFTETIKDKWDCTKLFLNCIRYFVYNYPDKAENVSNENKMIINREHIKFEISPIPRIYIYINSNKYISIVLPFQYKLTEDNRALFYFEGIQITEKILSDMFTILSLRANSRSNIGKSHNSIVELYMSNDEFEPISDFAFYIVECLLALEFGYIRHDFSPNDANGKIHPECHFDINFSKNATFKYGIESMLTNIEFEYMFDKNKDCLFLYK